MIDTINFILPTRGRAKTRLPQFINSVYDNADNSGNVKVTFVVDIDDTDTIAYFSSCNCSKTMLMNKDPRPHLARLMNMGFDLTAFKGESYAYGYIGDDFVCMTKGWDTILLDFLNKTKGMCAVWGDDGYLGNENGCPTFYFMPHRLWAAMETPYWVYPEAGKELTDVITRDILFPMGLLIKHEMLYFDHRHSTRPEVGADDTYHRLQTADNSKAVSSAVATWIKERQAAIRRNFKK